MGSILKAPSAPHKPARPRSQRGATMIEVLVTFVILAIGIMGLAGLQLRALTFSQSALYRSQASALADDILDRMRANRTAANSGNYASPLANGSSTFATTSQVLRDVGEWKAQIENLLPSGQGAISAISSGIVTIDVKWDDTRGDGNVTFTTKARL